MAELKLFHCGNCGGEIGRECFDPNECAQHAADTEHYSAQATSSEALLPCPFCGDAIGPHAELVAEGGTIWGVHCPNGQCPTFGCWVVKGFDQAEAIELWNTRTATSPVASAELKVSQRARAQELLDAELQKLTEDEAEHPDYTMVSEQAALRAIETILATRPAASPITDEAREALERIATEMEYAIGGGMSWISAGEASDFIRRVRKVAAALPLAPREGWQEEVGEAYMAGVERCAEWMRTQISGLAAPVGLAAAMIEEIRGERGLETASDRLLAALSRTGEVSRG